MHKSLLLSLFILSTVMIWNTAAYTDDGDVDSDSGISQETLDNVVLVDGEQDALPEELESEEIYEMEISLNGGLEYNDNIDDTAHDKKEDFITHIRPSFQFRRIGGRIQADITYKGDYLFYLEGRDSEEYRHTIKATVTGELIENLFFLSVQEDMEQVYRDISRGEAEDAENDTLNDLINRNRITISPYFMLRPTERTNLKLGYDFVDLRYSQGVDDQGASPISFNSEQYNFNYKKSQSHTFYLQLDHELSDRAQLFTGASVTRWIDNNNDDDKNQTDKSFYRYIAYIGGLYQFTEDLSLSVKAGPALSSPDEHSSKINPFVEAELTYANGRDELKAFYMTSYEDDAETGGSSRKSQYGIRWYREFDRSQLSTTLSYKSYEDEVELDRDRNEQDKDTYNLSLRYQYDLSDRLSCFIAYSADIYADHEKGDHRHSGSYGINYELSQSSKLGLSHQTRYTDAFDGDSYFTNRIMLDLTHRF